MKKNSVKTNAASIHFLDETKVHPALTEYFGYCLTKSALWLKSLHNEALRKFKIQSHHVGILKVLDFSGPISQIKLGDELGVDKASMVKCIDYLEQQGLVARTGDLKDRRIKNVSLTNQGRKLLKSWMRIRPEIEDQFLKNLSSSEQKVFKNLIYRLVPNKK